MSGTKELMCLVLPTDKPHEPIVPVKINDDATVAHLKELIKGKHTRMLDAVDLVLWKCSGLTDDNLEQTKTIQFNDSDGGRRRLVKLNALERISELFGHEDLSKQPRIHILVEVPDLEFPPHKQLRITSLPPRLPANTVERSETVSAIYRKLIFYRFILVRGTPASGKSTLAKLLRQYIKVQEHDVRVIWIGGWTSDDVKENEGWYSYLMERMGWIPGEKTVFIIDDAQLSYWDMGLWSELLKGIQDFHEIRAVAFASYGSPSSLIYIQGTTISVQPGARVSLLPTAHGDYLPAAGLFFTTAEFDDLVSKKYPCSEYYFDCSFLEKVFEITLGHQYRELKHTGQCYTWNLFDEQVDLVWFFRQFEGTIFGRGIPQDDDLRMPAVARVFDSVLRTCAVQDTDFTTGDDSSALQRCYRQGWLHTDYIDDTTQYFFPSWFHRWYIEWKLWGLVHEHETFDADNILDFVVSVISLFSPQMLSTTWRVNSAGLVQRPPEVQYQDEFYRCCHTRSNGSLLALSEFGTAKGRVDFYIPAKQWGVELLQNGHRLEQHSGRFSRSGFYGSTLSLTDYIILDCRTTQPRVPHPNLPRLYHIVFNETFSQVKILDNKLKVVSRGEFMLLNH